MCGRFQLKIDARMLAKIFDAALTVDSFEFEGEIFPSEEAPVIISNPREKQKRRLGLMKWGFKLPYSSRLLINARSETIDEKPTFKKPFQNKRCLIPAGAFFEWSGPKGNKTKHKITVENQEIFALAGIYDKFLTDEDEEFWAFTIITTEANSQLAGIHSRMPAILPEKDLNTWLDPESQPARAKELLRPYQSQLIIEPPEAESLF